MKSTIFTTNKGTFLLINMPEDMVALRWGEGGISVKLEGDKNYTPWGNYSNKSKIELINGLVSITEKQAAEIVDYFTTDEDFGKEDVFRDYLDKTFYDTALESFHSLIKSEGIHLYENPETHPSALEPESRSHYDSIEKEWSEAEEKTYRNPYLFKLIETNTN